MAKEVELKLRLLGDNGLLLYDHPTVERYCPHEPVTVDVETTYFDTAEYHLLKAGLALRVRYTDIDGYIQTVKSGGTHSHGLHSRDEWDTPVRANEIDLTVIQDDAIKQQLLEIATQHDIKPIFTTNFARSQWDLQLTPQLKVELAWDQGEIRAGDHVLPINEVELELKQGDQAYALFELAADIAHSIPLTVEAKSKAWRGYQLHQAAQAGEFYHEADPGEPLTPAFFITQAEQLKQQASG